MITSGFTNAPVSRILVAGVVFTAVLATITDSKYYLWIEVRPHLFDYQQFWRLATWQFAYTNSTEVLFAAMALYQLRVIERLWGSRKFLVGDKQRFGRINYLPAGPTAIIFALLAQYHAAIPYLYKYRLSSTTQGDREYGMLLTSKATSYILPLQLALSQLPGSAIAAAVGWIIGLAYRREVLPGAAKWRLPGWIMGGGGQRERYDNLRRRMEGDAGRATGIDAGTNNVRRRGMFSGIIDQFRTA